MKCKKVKISVNYFKTMQEYPIPSSVSKNTALIPASLDLHSDWEGSQFVILVCWLGGDANLLFIFLHPNRIERPPNKILPGCGLLTSSTYPGRS